MLNINNPTPLICCLLINTGQREITAVGIRSVEWNPYKSVEWNPYKSTYIGSRVIKYIILTLAEP